MTAEEPSALLRDTYRNELYIAFSALLACMMTEDQNPAAKNNSTRNTSNTRNSRSDSFISTLQSEGPNSDIISFDIFANWSEIQVNWSYFLFIYLFFHFIFRINMCVIVT
jgi:hypothetical protein